MERAEEVFSRVINEQMVGNGDALLAAFTAGGAAGRRSRSGRAANFYQLYAGRVVGCARSGRPASRPPPASGRKISNDGCRCRNASPSTRLRARRRPRTASTSRDRTATPCRVSAQAASATGIFEGINKASVAGVARHGRLARHGDDPTISIFDKAERLAMQNAGSTPDFYLCDPAVVDKYLAAADRAGAVGGRGGDARVGLDGDPLPQQAARARVRHAAEHLSTGSR